jgi:hypothetical protein
MRRFLLVLCVLVVAVVGNPQAALAAPPSNDDISGATVFTGLPFTDSVDTTEATYAATDAGCGLATVWYEFTPTESGVVELHTVGSTYDTTLALYTGDPSAPTLLQCNDDSVYGLLSQIVAEVVAGETYYISAGTCCGSAEPGTVGPGGNLVFTAQAAPPPVTEVSLTVDPQARVTRDGVVTVSGTVTCDQPASGHVSVSVEQRFTRMLAQGSSFASVECSPTPTDWSVQLGSYTGVIFGPGRATLTANANMQNASGSATAHVTQPLQLRAGS